MKLDPDCTRAILLAIEKVCDINHGFDSVKNLSSIACNYTEDKILYHAQQCNMAGMMVNFKRYYGDFWSVEDLSPKGHEFLANIRNENIWSNVKDISKKVGSSSLDAITRIAANVISELIKAHFNIR